MMKRLGFSIECAGLLYMVCMAVGLVRLWRVSSITVISVVGTLSAPALAAIVFIIIATCVPGLVGACKLSSPLNLTLPVVYMGLLFAVLQLGGGADLPLLRLRDVYAWSAAWGSPGMLLAGIGLQVFMLTALSRRGAETALSPSDTAG